MAIETEQEVLYRAFVNRPMGRLNDESILGSLAAILRADHGFDGIILRSADDLLAFDDEQARIARQILPTLDLPIDRDTSLRLVANAILTDSR